jgi:hypothetical protein
MTLKGKNVCHSLSMLRIQNPNRPWRCCLVCLRQPKYKLNSYDVSFVRAWVRKYLKPRQYVRMFFVRHKHISNQNILALRFVCRYIYLSFLSSFSSLSSLPNVSKIGKDWNNKTSFSMSASFCPLVLSGLRNHKPQGHWQCSLSELVFALTKIQKHSDICHFWLRTHAYFNFASESPHALVLETCNSGASTYMSWPSSANINITYFSVLPSLLSLSRNLTKIQNPYCEEQCFQIPSGDPRCVSPSLSFFLENCPPTVWMSSLRVHECTETKPLH